MHKFLMRVSAALAVMIALPSAPAMAQATRTWISGVGDDANPCSRTAPCKTFAGAISKTAASGEINVLDPGGFGGVTITKSITLRSDGENAGVLVSGTNGIVINAATTDRVVLQGLDIEGWNTGLSGVLILQARDVVVLDSTIRNFATAAITVGGSTKARLTVDNLSIIGNALGIAVNNSGGLGSAKVNNSLFIANTGAAIQVSGAGNRATLSGNKIYGTTGVELLSGGVANSFGNNSIEAPGAALTTLPQS